MNDKDAEPMASKKSGADLEEDLTLKLWEGDDSAKGEILKAWAGRTTLAISKAYPTLTDDEVEDVVCESVLRFWFGRSKYDPKRGKVGTLLYKIATHVAAEYVSGRLAWQKMRNKEGGRDAQFLANVQAEEPASDPPDDVGPKQSPIQKALQDCWRALPVLQQEILRAFGDAGSYPLNASDVGVELGRRHGNGVPIPGGNIRAYKKRGWDSIELCMKKKNHDISDMRPTDE